jgi:hypothetical protein
MAEKRFILTEKLKRELISQGFEIKREHVNPLRPSPFPGREEWIAARRREDTSVDLPKYFSCGYISEPAVFYFEEEEAAP